MDNTNSNSLFAWDAEQEGNLFSSLFPQGLSAPTFTETGSFFQDQSDNYARKNFFASSPLSKNGKDVTENFFGGSAVHKYPGFEIVVDPSSGVNPADKIKPIEKAFYYDKNNNDIQDADELTLFTVKLYISKLGTQLKDIYDDPKIQPDKSEILLFLEDNSGDWSNTKLYIKKGDNITAELITKMFAENSSFTKAIQSQYGISSSDLEELLRTGKVESNVVNLISCLFEISSFTISDPELLKGVGKAIKAAVTFIKENCSIDEKRWNPAKTPKGEVFEPFLFPGINNVLENIDDTEINNFLNSAVKSLKKEIKAYDKMIDGALHKDLLVIPYPTLFFTPLPMPGVDFAHVTLPETFTELLSQKYHSVRKVIDNMLAHLEDLDFSTILEQSIHAINAFVCGVWNGFIEAVCGIISLIQYLFEGAGEIADLLKDFKVKGLDFLEKVDDFILAFHEIDFGKIFSKLASGLKDMVLSGVNSSLVEIAYFCGIFIGFVVELVIEIVVGILFTGGALTVEAIFAKLAQIPKAIGELVSGSIKGIVKVGQKTVAGMASAFNSLLEFLLKGTDEILRIIDEVFAKFKNFEEIVLIDKFDDLLLPLIKILQKNPGFIKCIALVKENRVFGKWIAIELEAMIKLYTANTFRILNKALRGLDNVKLDKELKAMQKVLDEALEKLPVSKYNEGILQRSAFFTEKEIKKLFKPGKDFIEKGFMSSTHSEDALRVWLQDNPSHNVVFKIFGKNGKLIEKASILPHEAEILFKSGTEFLVESKRVYLDDKLFREFTEIILREK